MKTQIEIEDKLLELKKEQSKYFHEGKDRRLVELDEQIQLLEWVLEMKYYTIIDEKD